MNNVLAMLLLLCSVVWAQTPPPDDSWGVVGLDQVKTADVVPRELIRFFEIPDLDRKVKILEHAETMGDWPTRFEGPWQDVTRHFWTRVTLCYISNPVAPWTTIQPATMIGFKQIEFFDHTTTPDRNLHRQFQGLGLIQDAFRTGRESILLC